MRRRVLVSVLATTVMLMTACGTDSDAPAESQSADESHSVDTTTGATADPLVGQWIGTWSSGGESRQAILNVGKSNPLRATIDIPGRCGADWVESTRTGSTVSVDATVTYGECTDNRWSVKLTADEITATDPDNSSNSLRFTR